MRRRPVGFGGEVLAESLVPGGSRQRSSGLQGEGMTHPGDTSVQLGRAEGKRDRQRQTQNHRGQPPPTKGQGSKEAPPELERDLEGEEAGLPASRPHSQTMGREGQTERPGPSAQQPVHLTLHPSSAATSRTAHSRTGRSWPTPSRILTCPRLKLLPHPRRPWKGPKLRGGSFGNGEKIQ